MVSSTLTNLTWTLTTGSLPEWRAADGEFGTRWYKGLAYSELGHSANRGWHRDAGTGEVQIFERFSTMVSRAAEGISSGEPTFTACGVPKP